MTRRPSHRVKSVNRIRNLFESDHVSSHEAVQQLAYKLYKQHGGSQIDNWLQAQRVLKEEYRKGASNVEFRE